MKYVFLSEIGSCWNVAECTRANSILLWSWSAHVPRHEQEQISRKHFFDGIAGEHAPCLWVNTRAEVYHSVDVLQTQTMWVTYNIRKWQFVSKVLDSGTRFLREHKFLMVPPIWTAICCCCWWPCYFQASPLLKNGHKRGIGGGRGWGFHETPYWNWRCISSVYYRGV